VAAWPSCLNRGRIAESGGCWPPPSPRLVLSTLFGGRSKRPVENWMSLASQGTTTAAAARRESAGSNQRLTQRSRFL
jgi:hypothetical protein